ncbi:peptidoglycan DD-metalloendopeptidase family protein [Streptomyces cacaoi]|uniref:peptidoglycan DD-metalloendopeptidase family protein n=1 Tax=Streptomyces cacaoi TaxID=1898 RepID=UPI00374A0B83
MAISVGSVEVDVVPNTRGIYQHLRGALVPAAARAGEDAGEAAGKAFGPAMRSEVGQIGLQLGQQIGSQIAARITAEIRGALRDGVTQGGRTARPAATRQGEQAGGAFARSARARIEAAFRSLPDITIGADTSEADSDLQALRARMETLAGKRIGVDIDTAEARAEVTDLEEQLRRLGAAHPNPVVRADTAAARAQLAELRTELDRISADRTTIRLETDGTFGQRLRTAVQQAEASLPNINIGADTTPAQAEIASLRAQLTALRDVRVGVDIDAATAQARITDLQTRLERLSASDADIAVRVDASAAAAQLATVQAMVNRLDGQTARVHVDTSGAVSALLQLSIAVAGVAAIPAIPVLAAGIGAIGAAATAAGVGVGALALVAAPAIMGITEALQAQKAAEDAAASSAARGSQVAAQAARQALTRASAQQALVTAERTGGRQIAQAQQQVRQAKQAAADAAAQAAQRQQAATRAVQDAERSLATAQREARQAQEDLTAARRQAARELEDLNARLAGAELSQRDAVLGVREAQSELTRTMKDARSTELDRARAQLAYDQAVQRLKDQTTETRRLKSETAAANKAGIAGSDTVRSAQQRLAAAQQQVADRARAVRDAQAEAARVQTQTAREVAAAQARVGEATRNVAVAQRSAADAVVSAQRQIRSAELSAAGGADQAALAQAKYRQALADMTPAARGTFDAFVSLRTAFKGWSRALQPEVMSLFTRALNGMRKALPGLTPFVLGAAAAIDELMDAASKEVRTPFWQSFKSDLAKSVRPAVEGLGKSFGNVFKTIAGIVDAFLPHMDSISERMQRTTGRWADWAAGLKGSPDFERFLSYASRMGPIVGGTLGDIGRAVWEIGRALEPVSGPLLELLGEAASAVALIAEKAPWAIQLLWGIVVATRLWRLAMLALNVVLTQNPLVRLGMLIGLLVLAVIWAYNRFGWFRTGVQAAWTGIKTASLWAWNKVLKPTFAAIRAGIRGVGRFFTWLYRNAVLPACRGIRAAALWVWNKVLKPTWGAMKAGLRGLGAAFRWLYTKVVRPAWNGIRSVISGVWAKGIRPAFNAVRSAVGKVADAFRRAKDGIGKAWAKIKDLTRKPIKWVIDIVYNKGVRGLWNTAAKVLPIKKLPVFKFASGGEVRGPGTETSDSIPALLSRNEHVWTAREVRGAGGHAAVESMRAAARRRGTAYATGGAVAPTAPAQGGIGDWIGGKLRALGGKLKDWALGGVHAAAKAAAKPVRALINRIPGGKDGWGKLTHAVPNGVLDSVLNAIKGSEDSQMGGSGQWIKPVRAPYGTKFGVRGRMWSSGRHTGLDFPAPTGRKVVAVDNGSISSATSGGPYGKHVLINHGGKLASLYAHLSAITEKSGAVRQGQQIGRVGATGNVTGPHLHLEARRGGKPINPMPFLTGGGGSAGGKGVARWRGLVISVLRELGQPTSLVNTVLRRMNQESGGNPRAINNWDVNARRGDPSRGLMQTIGSTFRAYAGKYRSRGIYDPRANIYASMRYALARYGSLSRAYNRPGGYDSGGWLPTGLSTVYNGTGRPEPVLTGRQWDAITGVAARGSDGATLGDLNVQVFVGDREITDIARAEVRASNGRLVRTLKAGRR